MAEHKVSGIRLAGNWTDFEVLDASDGERLERWGDVLLIRPDPQVIWKTQKSPLWDKAHARYIRSAKGGGSWEYRKRLPEKWEIGYGSLRFEISPTGFKHTGLFPEQAVNWDLLNTVIRGENRPVSVLNLFAYTGGATLAAANAGASVCHVDASKGMVAWGRENAKRSSLSDKPVRWIVDDCKKFAEREIRRGVRYDIIVMDPPSYGRGPSGELWRLEDGIHELVEICAQLLSDKPLMFLLNSYTTGLSPSVMSYILGVTVGASHKGILSASEIGLPIKSTGQGLPCGSTALWRCESIGMGI